MDQIFECVVHHAGEFSCFMDPSYEGLVETLDCDPDVFSYFALLATLKRLGYVSLNSLWYFDPSMEDGMIPLNSDVGCRRMQSIAYEYDRVHLFDVHPMSQPDIVALDPFLEYPSMAPPAAHVLTNVNDKTEEIPTSVGPTIEVKNAENVDSGVNGPNCDVNETGPELDLNDFGPMMDETDLFGEHESGPELNECEMGPDLNEGETQPAHASSSQAQATCASSSQAQPAPATQHSHQQPQASHQQAQSSQAHTQDSQAQSSQPRIQKKMRSLRKRKNVNQAQPAGIWTKKKKKNGGRRRKEGCHDGREDWEEIENVPNEIYRLLGHLSRRNCKQNIKKIVQKMALVYKDWHKMLPFALYENCTVGHTSTGATPSFPSVYNMNTKLD
ncbi:hypothetical protein MTR_8g468230 [Medicago truncatula]|uniref:PB1-like domain-containing protein n=1 Tax=Medicago truncatula TaxID=3880 RepID=A0A072TQU1_MEDTR|nr:hypothetical protein MTR_8g468230 [Medicago truncatula]